MELKNERWKKIDCFDDYSVSNYGRICRDTDGSRTYRGRILKPWVQSQGYLQVTLNGQHKKVHILVLNAFVGKRGKGYQTNHKDGDKQNNNISNLEWTTPRKNMIHAYKTGLHPKKTGEDHPMSKLTKSDVEKIKLELRNKKHGDITRIAKSYGVNKTTISRIGLSRTWNAA